MSDSNPLFEFEAGPDKVEEDLEEVAGDVDDEASSGGELAEDETVDGDAMVERECFKNRKVSNMRKNRHANHLYLRISSRLIFHTLISAIYAYW